MDKKFEFRENKSLNKAFDIKDETGDGKLIPSITLYDIDYAILWQLQTGFQLRVDERDTSIKVPAMIANPEKWAQIQRFGFLRNADRQLIAPMIVMKRTDMERDNKFDKLRIPGGQKLIYLPPRNRADKFNNLNKAHNTEESVEYLVSVIPEHVTLRYDLIVWTNYTEQLNHIVQQINPHHNLLWGDSFQFVTRIGGWTFETVNNPGEDRIVKARTVLEVDGMLRNEHTVMENTVKKAFSTKRVNFMNEWEEDNFTIDYKPEIIPMRKTRIKPTTSLRKDS